MFGLGTVFYELLVGSPVFDSSLEGATNSAYTDYETYLGVPIRRDFRGSLRPMDGVWDMGAYEYDGTVPTSTTVTAPAAPTNLRKS